MLSVQDSLDSESPIILATLGLILTASIATFSIVTRRATLRARELAVRQWARIRGAALLDAGELTSAPARLALLSPFHAKTSTVIEGPHWTIAELTSDAPAEAKGNTPRWRLLVCDLPKQSPKWPTTALRPVEHVVSLIDLLDVSSFPSLSFGDQFIVFGTGQDAAKTLAESPAQKILPPDVGLVLTNNLMLLDFSDRRFQAPEWESILAVSERLLAAIAPAQ